MRGALSTALKVVISGAILYYLFRNIDSASFWDTVASVSPLSVVFAALLFMATQAVSAYRWSLILRKDMDISYFRLLSIYYIGMFFNNFLPTMVGGDLVKGYYLYRESGKGGLAVASIFMDRYSGFSALMFITAVAVVFGYPLIKGTGLPGFFVLLIGSFVCMSLVIWVGFLHTRAMDMLARIQLYGINKKIDAFYNILMGYKRHPGILWRVFVISIFIQAAIIVGYYILGRGLGMDVGLGYYFLFLPLTTAVAMLPVSLSGLGIREGAFVFLFTRAGATGEQALTLSLMWFAVTALVSTIGGFEYVRLGGRRPIAGKDAPL